MLTTPSLLITPWTEGDAAAFFELSQDEGLRIYPINNYQQESIASALDWIRVVRAQNQQTGLGKWAVWSRRSEKDLLGLGGLTPWSWEGEELVDITYRLRKSAWGQGLGLELAQGLIDHAFGAVGLNQITATITPENYPSRRLAEKLGMRFDRHITLLGVPTDLYRLYR
jgi:RimJ/RimL family protein N-acetyltransferase